MILLSLFSLFYLVLNINQQCNYNSSELNKLYRSKIFQEHENCPQNSFCLQNGYCACNEGYIGNCSQFALALDDTQISVDITNKQFSFFKFQVESNEEFMIMYFIEIKQSSISSLVFDIWEDNGYLEDLNQNNKIENIQSASKDNIIIVNTPYITSTNQPNGMRESIILGLILKDQNSTNLTISGIKINSFNYWRLIIVIIIVIASIALIIFIAFVLSLWLKKRRNIQEAQKIINNCLQNIEKDMPRYKFKEARSSVILEDSCPICLEIFTQDKWLRKTMCKHIFHQECLDKWCSSNPVCPLCKKSLQNINQNQQKMKDQSIDKNNIRQNLLL